jgi:hypothetical protein
MQRNLNSPGNVLDTLVPDWVLEAARLAATVLHSLLADMEES